MICEKSVRRGWRTRRVLRQELAVIHSIGKHRSTLIKGSALWMILLVIVCGGGGISGCETDSFFDPSRTGYFEHYPTMIPVLDRLDVIEQEQDYFANATPVMSEDLEPRDLEYYLYPGDIVTVGIFELFEVARWATVTRRIDAGGYYRVPELGDIRAAGLTAQQFEDEIIQQLKAKVMPNPQVDIVVEQSSGLRYTVYGYLQNPGVFNLANPDLRLLDALAIAGGVPVTTERVYVIRQVILSEQVRPSFQREGRNGASAPTPKPREPQPTDVEELIKQLEPPSRTPQEQVPPRPRQPSQPEGSNDSVSPGMLQDTRPQPQQPQVDIDELEPIRVPGQVPVDVDVVRPQTRPSDEGGDRFIYDSERGEWVRVPAGTVPRGQVGVPTQPRPQRTPPAEPSLTLSRVILVDYGQLARGDTSQNLVVRPNDRIYIDGPRQGFVYIDGEINRPGVYGLPNVGTLTLSRFVAASGGLGAVAIPERVDLIRKVGVNREAAIRLNLAAIRQKTEPDVVLKPDDHIIIGTSWIATPLAVIRNGFRATYGFGFLLDRNFGGDVFGPEPQTFR
jgi:polysaccharide export outer membrane protein